MKTFKLTLSIILILMLSVIVFYTSNLLFSVVSNYEAVSKTSLAFLPLAFITAILVTLLICAYRFYIRKINDMYFIRLYSILILVFSVLGLAFSIVVGTYVYDGFTKRYIFHNYPLFTLIINVIFLLISGYGLFYSERKIVKENAPRIYKSNAAYALRTLGVSMLLVFALNRLGAFCLLPIYYSTTDGAYLIPYYIQLLIPALIMVNYCIFENCGQNRKIPLISSAIALGYTIFSLIYMIILSHNNYPLCLNAITAIQLFERLVKYPVNLLVMYVVSFSIPFLSLLNQFIKVIKNNKKEA